MTLWQERAEMQRERDKMKSAHDEMTNQYQTQFDTLKKQNRTLLQRLEETQEELQEATKTGESTSHRKCVRDHFKTILRFFGTLRLWKNIFSCDYVSSSFYGKLDN